MYTVCDEKSPYVSQGKSHRINSENLLSFRIQLLCCGAGAGKSGEIFLFNFTSTWKKFSALFPPDVYYPACCHLFVLMDFFASSSRIRNLFLINAQVHTCIVANECFYDLVHLCDTHFGTLFNVKQFCYTLNFMTNEK